MALYGKISKIIRESEGVRLELEQLSSHIFVKDDQTDQSPDNCANQSSMLIERVTLMPKIGSELWGNSEKAWIESNGVTLSYKRNGDTNLIENWPEKITKRG